MAVGTILAIGIGRYVIIELAHTDPVVVAAGAATYDTGMIIAAGTESTRGMTGAAIFRGRHMGIERRTEGHAARRPGAIRNMAGDTAITHDAGMIDAERRDKTLGVMARSTISGGSRMGGHCR